eukprot:jgi/Hompol1/4722/HPOL_003850-RA
MVAAFQHIPKCNYLDFMHRSYLTASLKQVYRRHITVVNLGNLEPCDALLVPWTITKKAGRPSNTRLRSKANIPDEDKLQCGKCYLKGHNIRTCDRRAAAAAAGITFGRGRGRGQ